ncbi:hypothetical protein QOT17_012989 [Balamuthia mandrillaris]
MFTSGNGGGDVACRTSFSWERFRSYSRSAQPGLSDGGRSLRTPRPWSPLFTRSFFLPSATTTHFRKQLSHYSTATENEPQSKQQKQAAVTTEALQAALQDWQRKVTELPGAEEDKRDPKEKHLEDLTSAIHLANALLSYEGWRVPESEQSKGRLMCLTFEAKTGEKIPFFSFFTSEEILQNWLSQMKTRGGLWNKISSAGCESLVTVLVGFIADSSSFSLTLSLSLSLSTLLRSSANVLFACSWKNKMTHSFPSQVQGLIIDPGTPHQLDCSVSFLTLLLHEAKARMVSEILPLHTHEPKDEDREFFRMQRGLIRSHTSYVIPTSTSAKSKEVGQDSDSTTARRVPVCSTLTNNQTKQRNTFMHCFTSHAHAMRYYDTDRINYSFTEMEGTRLFNMIAPESALGGIVFNPLVRKRGEDQEDELIGKELAGGVVFDKAALVRMSDFHQWKEISELLSAAATAAADAAKDTPSSSSSSSSAS